MVYENSTILQCKKKIGNKHLKKQIWKTKSINKIKRMFHYMLHVWRQSKNCYFWPRFQGKRDSLWICARKKKFHIFFLHFLLFFQWNMKDMFPKKSDFWFFLTTRIHTYFDALITNIKIKFAPIFTVIFIISASKYVGIRRFKKKRSDLFRLQPI